MTNTIAVEALSEALETRPQRIRAIVRWITVFPSMGLLIAGLLLAITAGAVGTELHAVTEASARAAWPLVLAVPESIGHARALAQLCFLVGAVALIVSPALEGNRMLVALQSFLAISSFLFFVTLPPPIMLVGRLLLSVGVLWGLSRARILQNFRIRHLLRPTYYLAVLRGDHGSAHAGALGLELLGVGYVTGHFVFFLAGSIYLVRFAQLGYRETGLPLIRAWIYLNGAYAVASAILLGQQMTSRG